MDDLVAVARIVRTRGLKGEVVAEVLTDFPERFDSLVIVIAVYPSGESEELKIENFWFQNDRIILKFAGFDSLEKSEELRNAEICVAESDAVALAAGEYFDWQLKGCRVETLDHDLIGEVADVMRTGGTELLEVQGAAKRHLIPFAEAICPEVDIENKLITVDLPDGLLEF